jgi:hypothetical protein
MVLKFFTCVEHTNLLDSLDFLPMCLKSMHKSVDLSFKHGYYPTSTRPTIWIMWDLIPSIMGQTLYQVFRESEFSNGMSKNTKFSVIRKSCWPTAWMTSMYWGRHAVFRNLFLKLVKTDPFRQAITISSICNKVLRTMFLKPGSYPRPSYLL